MTAAATTRLIARYYAAFNAQDVEGMLACLGPGFVHDVSQGSRRRGKKLFAEFLHPALHIALPPKYHPWVVREQG